MKTTSQYYKGSTGVPMNGMFRLKMPKRPKQSHTKKGKLTKSYKRFKKLLSSPFFKI